MPEFRRIKVRATLESEVMLLAESEIERTVDGLHARLAASGLKIVTLEPEEIVTAPATLPAAYDD